MAKVLQFQHNGSLYGAEPQKLERKKIYGYKEISAIDSNGNECRQCFLDASGTVLIPQGAIKLASLDKCGNSIERNEMVLVDADGNPPEKFPSSFDAPIVWGRTVDEDTFLDHIWKGVYQISNPELAAVADGKIYSFPFSYHGGHSRDEGFLLTANGACYLFYGEKIEFQFLHAPDAGVFEDMDEDVQDDDFEFEMM